MEGASPRTREDKDHLIDQLRMELQAERNKNKALHDELRALREAQVQAQAATEQEEELITNTLMKRMNELKKDRDRLAMQVEQEEEYLTNTLQKKLRELTKEKAELENRLEAEEEYIVNKLQGKLDEVLKEKGKLEQTLRSEHEEVEKLRQLSKQLTEALAQKTAALEKERHDVAEQQAKLAEQLETLKREKALSEQRAQREHQLLNQVTHDKVALELERERTDEREFNVQLAHKLELAARGNASATRPRSGSGASLPLAANLSGPIGASGSNSPTRKEPMPASSSGSRTPQLKLNLGNTSAPLSPRLGISPRSSPHALAAHSPRSHPMLMTSPHLTATALHQPGVSSPHVSSPRLPRAGVAKSGKVLRQGWVWRRRSNEPHWNRQWCQLRDNEELWSWPETATIVSDNPIDSPEAILDLDTVKAVKTTTDGKDGHKYVFYTMRADGVMELFALDTKEQLDEWSNLFRDLCPCLSK